MEVYSYTPEQTKATMPELRASMAIGKAALLKIMKSPTPEELVILSLF